MISFPYQQTKPIISILLFTQVTNALTGLLARGNSSPSFFCDRKTQAKKWLTGSKNCEAG